MTKLCIRSLILLVGSVLILPISDFAQPPSLAAPSAGASIFQAEIAKNPEEAWPYVYLAFAEIDANHPDEAIAAAKHALGIPFPSAAYREELECRSSCKPWPWTIFDPHNQDHHPAAYYALGSAYAFKGDLANALAQMDAGLSQFPESPFFLYGKGRILVAGGESSHAGEMLSSTFNLVAKTRDLRTLSAWSYLPEDIDLNLGWLAGISQYYAGQYPQALESARQLVALHDRGGVSIRPNHVWVLRAIADSRNGLVVETKGTAIGSSQGPTYCPLWPYPLPGNYCVPFEKIDGNNVLDTDKSFNSYAIEPLLKGPVGSVAELDPFAAFKKQKIVRQAIPLTKADAKDFALLALTLNANGDREQAFTAAQKAIGLDPGNFWAELSYGLVLEDSNRSDEALKALETPNITSDLPMAEALRQIHRAVLYAKKGDSAKAQEIYFSSVSHIDPRCLPAVKEKEVFMALVQPLVNAHIAKAKQLDAEGKYSESLPEYAQALGYAANEQDASTLRASLFAAAGRMPTPPEIPDNARRHVVRGELLLKQGMLDRALVEFNEALRMAPYIPRLYYNTALIYGQLKQYEQAIRQMHLYQVAAPEAPDVRAAQDEITRWELLEEVGGKS